MHLKRLEIHGFKSFAQKATLEFDKGIIAIVGPNGSGKSNVADSLRWVLGEQSAKLMRGKKSDDVIFAGSDKKTRLGFAEVIATFDNRDRRIPVDAAEVSIGRRIDRSGESEYLINGNKVRLLDVVDLVLKSNIGTSRYTVIGQGTIDQMILAGPTEVKNLLDEASGVKTYYMRREKTLKRLEQTAQNLMRAEDLIAEIEPRLKSLRRQAKRMEARSELEQELKLYQREYFGATYWQLKKQIDAYAERLGTLDASRTELETFIAEFRKDLEKSEAHSGQEGQRFRTVQEQLTRLQSHKNKLLEDLSLVRGKMQGMKTGTASDPATLQVEVHGKGRQILEIREKIRTSQDDQNKLGMQLEEQKRTLENVSQTLTRLYEGSKNPAQVDWSVFDLELKSVETAFEAFHRVALDAANVSEVQIAADGLKQTFARFAHTAREIVRNPQASMEAFQKDLEEVLNQKERVAAEVNRLELSLSQSRLSMEFLEKQATSLEQEKLHLDLELKKAQSGSSDEFFQSLASEEGRITGEVEALSRDMQQLEISLREYYEAEEARQKDLHKREGDFRLKQDELSKIRDQQSQVQIEKAKFDTQMEVLAEEVRRILGEGILREIGERPIENVAAGLDEKIMKLKNQLDMIGGMDELTLKEYQETEARYTSLHTQVEDLKKGMQDLRDIIEELDAHIKTKFNEAFHKINEKFEHYFRVLFNGGRAYLSVLKAEDGTVAEGSDSEDAALEDAAGDLRPEEKIVRKYEKGASAIVGIDIKATPPNKKLATIQALSGGERALTSIALLCSLLTCFPSPFVVLDEVDAALDDANTIRFGQILGTLANQTQFITITHNRETMTQSNMIYGVTMGDDGISKLLSVRLEQAKQYAK